MSAESAVGAPAEPTASLSGSLRQTVGQCRQAHKYAKTPRPLFGILMNYDGGGDGVAGRWSRTAAIRSSYSGSGGTSIASQPSASRHRLYASGQPVVVPDAGPRPSARWSHSGSSSRAYGRFSRTWSRSWAASRAFAFDPADRGHLPGAVERVRDIGIDEQDPGNPRRWAARRRSAPDPSRPSPESYRRAAFSRFVQRLSRFVQGPRCPRGRSFL